jgi:cation/acetate symporter
MEPTSMDVTRGRFGRVLAALALAAWFALALAVPALAPAFNLIRVDGVPLGLWAVAVAAPVCLVVLIALLAVRHKGRGGGWPLKLALAQAATFLGGGVLVGYTAAIYNLGFDGLAYPLGLVAGIALSAMLIAARDRFHDFLADSRALHIVTLTVCFLAIIWLLAAELRAAALAFNGLSREIEAVGLLGAAAVSVGLAVWAARSGRGVVPDIAAIVFVVAAAAFGLVAVGLTAGGGGVPPMPQAAFGQGVTALAAGEQALIAAGLSDFSQLRPMASPFLQLSMIDYLGTVFAIAAGVAVFGLILPRVASRPGPGTGEGLRATAVAALVVMLAATAIPAFVVFARLGLVQTLLAGVPLAAMPDTIRMAFDLGWIEICGVAAPADFITACAAIDSHGGLLREHDIGLTADVFAFAAPLLAGLPVPLAAVFWFSVLLASLYVAWVLLTAIAQRSSFAVAPRDSGSFGFSLAFAGAIAALASVLAMLSDADLATLHGDGFALLGAGLFPALALCLVSRRMSSAGMTTAIVTGTGLVMAYGIATRVFPAEVVAWAGLVTDTDLDAIETFETLETLRVAVAEASSDDARAMAALELHTFAADILRWSLPRPMSAVLVAIPAAFAAGWFVSRVTLPNR